jgi:hypothetical protein
MWEDLIVLRHGPADRYRVHVGALVQMALTDCPDSRGFGCL